MTPARTREPLGQPTAHRPVDVSPFTAMLGASVTPMIAAAPVIVLVFWVTGQSAGGLSSLLGVFVAVVFFASGLFVMSRLTRANPLWALAAAVAVYMAQVTFLGVVILSLSGAGWLDGTAFALSVLVVALVWQLSLVRAFVRLRRPVYDEPASGKPAEGPVAVPADPTDQRLIL